MTREEFNSTGFKKGMKVRTGPKDEHVHDLISVDFEDEEFCIMLDDELFWVPSKKCSIL